MKNFLTDFPLLFSALVILAFICLVLSVLLARFRGQLNDKTHALQLAQTKLELCENDLDEQRDALHHFQQRHESLIKEHAQAQALQNHYHDLQNQLHNLQQQYRQSSEALSVERERNKQLLQQSEFVQNSEARLAQQFELLATKVFESKEKNIETQHRLGLEGLLNPLRTQLESFRQQVQQSYENEAKQRHSLVDQILNLQSMNQRLSEDANRLAQALSGDNKQQGDWGEVVLEKILQDVGLRKGIEYHTQLQGQNQHGQVIKPDIVVNLPDNKAVIVDSKVSLSAYQRFYHSDDVSERRAALNEHCLSLRNHIRGLARKDYHSLHQVTSLDYVLLFVPIEAAYIAAVTEQTDLVKMALESNILLVSPSSLMVALRTIQNLWKMEYQQQNAQKIAARAGMLYDKFAAFTQDLQQHGQALDKAQQSYQQAMNKLSQGKGNLLRQAELLRELHVPVSKQVADNLDQYAQTNTAPRLHAVADENEDSDLS